MESNYFKYSEVYSRYWFRFLGYDLYDTEKNKQLTKGQFHNLHRDIADELAGGAELPKRFKLIEREPVKKLVERHGKIREK